MFEKIVSLIERIAVALEAIATGNGLPAATPVGDVKPAAVKQTRAAKQAATVAAVVETNFLDDEPEKADAEVKTYTKDEVRAAVIAFQKRHSQPKAQALIASFGSGTLGGIDPSKYPEVIAAAAL